MTITTLYAYILAMLSAYVVHACKSYCDHTHESVAIVPLLDHCN